MIKVAIIGCGWLGMPLSEQLQLQEYKVSGFARREEVKQSLRSKNIELLESPFQLEGQDIVISTITPPKDEQDLAVHTQIAKAASLADVRQLIYTSSISVYPDLPKTVSESEADPFHPIYLLEQTYLSHFPTATILRLGGLYGGERHPAKYLAGKTDVAKPLAPINLVSRDRVIYTIQKTIERKIIGETINVVDDEHPSRIEYYTSKCVEMSLAPPHFASDERLGKLISSDKWHKLLG